MIIGISHTYVIDANVLFSAFISGKDIYPLLFSTYTIYVPDFAFTFQLAAGQFTKLSYVVLVAIHRRANLQFAH